jgi:hypothetical protein
MKSRPLLTSIKVLTHNLEVLGKGYNDLKIKYEDLKAAYERKSVLRVIEKVRGDAPYDVLLDEGENVVVHKPRRSGKKHSSRSQKKVSFGEGLPMATEGAPSEMIILNKPVNRLPGHITPPVAVGPSFMGPAPANVIRSGHPIVQKIQVHPMAHGLDFTNTVTTDSHRAGSYEVREYPVDDRDVITQTYTHTSAPRSALRDSNFNSGPNNLASNYQSNLRGSMMAALSPGPISTNPFESAAPLKHVQSSVSSGALPPGFLEAAPQPPVIDSSQPYIGQYRGIEHGGSKIQTTVSSRIAAEKLPEENRGQVTHQIMHSTADQRGSAPRPEERGSSLDYSRGEFSFLTNSPNGSLIRNSIEGFPNSRPPPS